MCRCCIFSYFLIYQEKNIFHRMSENGLRARFLADGINIKNEWLQNMINNGNSSYEMLYKAFMETNIEQTTNVNKEFTQYQNQKVVISSNNVVQIEEIVDISLPFNDRAEFRQDPNGTLKLLLNIGGYQFIGIEKTKITNNQISTFTTPGSKLRIKAGSVMRYGVLFIGNDNVEFLGGFSPDLVEKRKQIYNPSNNQSRNTQRPIQQPQPVQRPPEVYERPTIIPPPAPKPEINDVTPEVHTPQKENKVLTPNSGKSHFISDSDPDDDFHLSDDNEVITFGPRSDKKQQQNAQKPASTNSNQQNITLVQPDKQFRIDELEAKPAEAGKAYLADAKFERFVALFVDGEKFACSAQITDDNGLQLLVSVDHEALCRALGAETVYEFLNLDELAEQSQRFIAEQYFAQIYPLKVVDTGDASGTRFVLHDY